MNKPLLIICSILLWYGSSCAQTTFTLPEAIDYALKHHQSIKVANLDNENSKWQYREVLAQGMPRINGNVNYNYFYVLPQQPLVDFISPSVYNVLINESVTTEDGSTLSSSDIPEPQTFNVAFNQKHSLSLGLSGEVLVFDGNFLKGLKASRKFMELSEKQIQLTEQDIVHNVTRAYQAVLVAERNRNIIQNNIDNVTKSLREVEITYENGFVEELDVDRLKLSLENLTVEQDKLEQLIELNYNLLRYQMAFPLEEELRVADDLETTVEKMILDPQEYVAEFDPEKRPEHRLILEALELDELDMDRIKQGYVPSVSANVAYGQNLNRNNLFSGSEAGFLGNGSVGLSARIPIYDGGFTKSKIEQKKIVIDKRQIELEEFDRAMKLQVYNAQAQLDIAKSSLEAAKRSLALNEKIYNKTQIKYREGVGSSIEVTQAEGSLYGAQAQYVNALYDLLTAKTELEIATGDILTK
ncbi:MAG: TolC family protein [Bacteroidota bacterium]